MRSLRFDLREQFTLEALTSGVVKTGETGGEVLNPQPVRSSIVWRLGTGDASSTVPNALFRPEEDTRGHLLLMEGIIGPFGIPLPPTVNFLVSSGSMTRPGRLPSKWSHPAAWHGPVARPGGWRLSRNRMHGK